MLLFNDKSLDCMLFQSSAALLDPVASNRSIRFIPNPIPSSSGSCTSWLSMQCLDIWLLTLRTSLRVIMSFWVFSFSVSFYSAIHCYHAVEFDIIVNVKRHPIFGSHHYMYVLDSHHDCRSPAASGENYIVILVTL